MHFLHVGPGSDFSNVLFHVDAHFVAVKVKSTSFGLQVTVNSATLA